MERIGQRMRCKGDVVRRLPVLWRDEGGAWCSRTVLDYGDGVKPSERYTFEDGTLVTMDQIDHDADALRAAGRRSG